MDIKITEEDKYTSMLCSFLDSWDNLAMAIGRNNTTLKVDDVVASLLSEEIRQDNMECLIHDALMVRGRPIDRGKGESSGTLSKWRGISKTKSRSPRLVM